MSDPQAVARDVDVRGFSHALAPIRKRALWKLESLRVQLARQSLRVKEQERLAQSIGQALRSQAETAQAAMLERVEPHSHRQTLLYLVDLHRQLDQAQRKLTLERERLSLLKKAGCDQHCIVQGLDRHHGDALARYAADKRARDCAEVDRDWMARLEPMQALAHETGQQEG